jgi:hypothetical protein
LNDLLENSEYDFRVRAVNKAGESEPSVSTGKVRITEYPGRYFHILVKSLKAKIDIVF